MDDFMNAEISDHDLILQWLNTASYSQDPTEKLDILHKLQEFLIRKVPNLLPEFLSSVLNFTTDTSNEIRKALVGFIEEVCKIDESFLTKVMVNLHMLLCVESIPVQKRVIQAAITIYRRMLNWLCKAPVISTEMEQAWNQLTQIKGEIVNMVDSDNDGVRTSAVKFLECVILLQTYPDQHENRPPNDFSLEDVPLTLKIARRRKLEEEANNIFDILIKFNGSQHISSANLFACVGALTNISKNRPEFMGKVVAAIERLYSNWPPTLSTTQVNSIRKKLKSELTSLIKHHAAYEYLENITTMMTDLGYTQQDLQKLIPKIDERRKYMKRVMQDELTQQSKKARIEPEVDSEQQKIATEANEKFVSDKLNIDVAVQLVLSTMLKLPATIPNQFKIDYTAFMKMGHVGELKVLGKMLAIQLLEVGLGPGAELLKKAPAPSEKLPEPEPATRKRDAEEELLKKERVKVPRIKTLKLAEITKPLEKNIKERLLLGTVQRILLSDKITTGMLRQKVVVTLAASFNERVRQTVLAFLLSDLRIHLDTALAWLFEEYSIMQGFTRLPALRRDGRLDQGYTNLLSAFISQSSADALVLSRLLLEAPMVTDQALEQLCGICREESRCAWALGLLRDLIIRKPPKQITFLNALLSHTTHEILEVRECAISHILDMYRRQSLKSSIEKFVRLHLDFLRLAQPPLSLFGEAQGRLMMGNESWNDDLVRACLSPYVSLLPLNESLIHDLAKVYVQTNADTKRTILRLLEAPIRTMGMDSAELLKLVEECPKGSETLVTRVIHILTDKGQPSPQLVQHVRELYHTRVSDVRFLIPVLNGLSKKEIISALPKLIKLNPVVVREVFNRLFGLHGDSPITPTELLVALHLIDPVKADLKTVMKATSMCLNEKQVFTQEILAVVLQQLMDQTPLPTLLMRTVIQALGLHPRLSGFVMNILQRLILKQVWKQKVVWEGFVKCCQRTKPQSFSVLMQLPAPQLSEALNMCADLREPLKQYMLNFTEGQRTHIPAAVQEILLGPPIIVVQKPPEMVPPPSTPEILPPPLSSMEPLPPGME